MTELGGVDASGPDTLDSAGGGGAVAAEPITAAGVCTGPGPCDVHPFGHGKNWVNEAGGLPPYIRAIAHALARQGHDESRAISTAVATVKRWAAGGGGVKADTRARAAAAVAQWEAMKAKAHASQGETVEAAIEADKTFIPKPPVQPDEDDQQRPAAERTAEQAEPAAPVVVASADSAFAMTEAYLVALADSVAEFDVMGMDDGPTHAGLCMKAADTGRVLMLQRALEDPNDPAAGTWEFPGGAHEDGDQTSLHTAIREWQEEVGRPFPQNALVAGIWSAPNGVYQGHIVVVPDESDVNPDSGRMYPNPDDPDGDNSESVAWWHPDDAAANPALRSEAQDTPWELIKAAGIASPPVDSVTSHGDGDAEDLLDNGADEAEEDDAKRRQDALAAAGAFNPQMHPRDPGGKFAPLGFGAGYDKNTKGGRERNAQVKNVQTRLTHLGYSVGPEGVDGMLGPHTTAGIKDFQRTNGLSATGTIDRKTWDMLTNNDAKRNAGGSGTSSSSSGASHGHAASRFVPPKVQGVYATDPVELADLLEDEPDHDDSVGAEALLTASPSESVAFGLDAFEALATDYDEFAISAEDRRKAAKEGTAMGDGSYPIRNAGELRSAVRTFPRGAGNNKTKAGIKRHIVKRARAMKMLGALPDTWNIKPQTASAGLIELAEAGDWTALVAAAVTEVPPVPVPDEVGGGVPFRIPLVLPTGLESGDRREFKAGGVSHRDLPIPLYFQKQTDDGHKASVIVGRIDKISKAKNGLGDAQGVFDTGPDAQDALRLVRGLFLRGVSGDVDKIDAEMSQGDDGKPKVTFDKGRLTAATLVGKPAFAECMIELPGDEEWESNMSKLREEGDGDVPRSITAAGGPMFPPKEWFEDPHLTEPSHLTVTDDGRVFGHIAAWDQFHIGMPFQRPPRSKSGYKHFATGQLKTQEGEFVNVGQLTLSGGHADLTLDAEMAIKHYDDTDSAVADVAVGEDQFGIWVAGAARPDLTDMQMRQFRASDSSGDWRPINGALEMVACLQVNCAGFPTPRAAVASGGWVTALVAAGAPPIAHRVIDSAHQGDLSSRIEVLEAQRRSEVAAELRAQVASAKQMEVERLRTTVASIRPVEASDADPKAGRLLTQAEARAAALTPGQGDASLGAMTAAARIYHFKHGWVPLDHEAVQAHDAAAKASIDQAVNASADIKDMSVRRDARRHLNYADSARRKGNMGEAGTHMRLASHSFSTGKQHGIASDLHKVGTDLHLSYPPNNASPEGNAVDLNPTIGRRTETQAPAMAERMIRSPRQGTGLRTRPDGSTSATEVAARAATRGKYQPGEAVTFRQPGGTHRSGTVTEVDGAYRTIEARPIAGVGKREKHRVHSSQISPAGG